LPGCASTASCGKELFFFSEAYWYLLMSFLAPSAFFLAVLLPIIIAMYLLKLRRTEQVVSSVYLWRRMVRDVEANAPWQRLRRNPLLLLQLLFLSLLILALAQPFTWTVGASGQSVIFILDISASMASTDASPNRLEVAKDQARQLIEGLADDARVTVITASDQAQVLVSSSQDRRQIYQMIDSIQVNMGGSNLSPALGLASAIATRRPDTEIIILSDGRVNMPERLGQDRRMRYFPIGTSADNQAISLLSIEARSASGELTAFAQITNYSAQAVQRRLELYADGILINAFDLDIPAGGQRAVVGEDLPAGTVVISALLTGQDALPLDDQAWALVEQGAPVPVTLVTEGNRFLETGLNLLAGLKVTLLAPGEFEARDASSASEPTPTPAGGEEQVAQITIFDAYVPLSADLPDGSLLFIAPPRSTKYFSVNGMIEQPAPRLVDPDDPLVSNINISQVNILDAIQISDSDWSRRILEGDAAGAVYPLLTAGKIDDRRVAILAFDIRRSDLPLQVAFPLLLANLTDWLSPGRFGDLPSQVSPGEAVTLSLPAEVSTATVTRPDFSKTNLSITAGRGVFADTNQLGLYQVSWGNEGVAHFAVNLFSPQESDVAPAQNLPVLESLQTGDDQLPMQARRDWWRPFGFAALALLMAEWFVYQRANLVRLAGRWSKRTTS
jgi:Ca-activated chloride channel family protein